MFKALKRSILIANSVVLLFAAGCDQTASSNNISSAAQATKQTPASPAPAATQPKQTPKTAPPGQDQQHGSQSIPVVLGPPPIEFDPPVLELGMVRPNQKVTGTIYIQNLSDKSLKILSSKADCSCTSVDLSNVVIGPGERHPFQANYNPASAMGEKRSAVRVKIEGYDIAEVSITAFVSMPVKSDPTFISLLPDQQGVARSSGEYVVESLDKKPFRVLAVNQEPPPFVDFNPETDEPRNSYKLKWDLSTVNKETCLDARGKRVPGWLIVETDHPDCPVFDLEVRHECNRRANPKDIDTWYMPEKRYLLGGIKEGQSQEFEVITKWMPRKPMTDVVKTVISESPQFKAELVGVTPQADGMLVRIKLTPTPGHKGLIYGTLRLHSGHQSNPLIVTGSVN